MAGIGENPFNAPSASTGGVSPLEAGHATNVPENVIQKFEQTAASAMDQAVQGTSRVDSSQVLPTEQAKSSPIAEESKEKSVKLMQKTIQTHLRSAISHFSKGNILQGFASVKNAMGALGVYNSAALVFSKVQNAMADSTKIALQKIESTSVRDAAKVALSELKKGESKEIEVDNKTYVVMKEVGGGIDVLEKQKEISSGKTCLVFKAHSQISDETVVLKFSKSGVGDGENEADFKNEARLLAILNQNGPQTGIQGKTSLTELKRGEGELQLVAKSVLYKGGDFQKNVSKDAFVRFFGGELGNKSVVDAKIEQKLTGVKDALKTQLEKGDKNEMKRLIRAQANEISTYIKTLQGREAHDQLVNKLVAAEKALVGESPDLGKIVDDLLKDTLSKLAESTAKVGDISLKTRLNMGADLVEGLRSMHAAGVRHGDIKPLNFFCDDTSAKIADFGGCLHVNDPVCGEDGEPVELQGTIGYALGAYTAAFNRSENKEQRSQISQAHDIRQMGIALYEMSGAGDVLSLPDERNHEDELYQDVLYQRMQQDMEKVGISPDIAELVVKMAKPIDIRKGEIPDPFPLPVSDQELATLAASLRNATV